MRAVGLFPGIEGTPQRGPGCSSYPRPLFYGAMKPPKCRLCGHEHYGMAHGPRLNRMRLTLWWLTHHLWWLTEKLIVIRLTGANT